MIPVLANNCLHLITLQIKFDQIVIHAERTIIDYSLQEISSEEGEEPKWLLYCVDETGRLYSVTSQQFTEQLRVSSNSTDNIDIFSDLLEPDHDDTDIALTESTVPVFKLTNSHVLYEVKGKPKSLVSYGNAIVVLSADRERLKITAMMVDFSDGKPVVKTATKTTDFYQSRKYDDDGPYSGKIMTCSMLEKKESSKTSDTVHIDKNLYRALFGTNALLLNTPVYLFCPPDGNVYAMSFNSFFSESDDDLTLFERQPADIIKWKLLCETAGRVVNILTMTVPCSETENNTENMEDDFHVLLFCCCNGSIITFHYDHMRAKHEYISQLTVRGPVLASTTLHNRLYHSTPSNIYETCFEVVNGPHQVQKLGIITTRCRRQAQIYSMSVENNNTFIETRDAPCILHCFQKNGQQRSIDSSVAFDKDSNDFSSTLHIKDVLLAINKTDREQQNIVESISIQEKLLEQISLASFLLNRYLSRFDTLKASMDIPPITLKNKVVWNPECHSQVELNCELTNEMPRNLSCDWSLEVSAIPLSPTSCSKLGYPSMVVPLLEGLKSHETIRVGLMIPSAFVFCGFEILVTLHLDMNNSLPDRDKQFLSMNVCSKRLDILHFMVSKQVLVNSFRYSSTNEEITDMIEGLAHQQPLSKCLFTYNTGPVKETNVTVTKSLHFTRRQYQQLTHDYGEGPTGVLKYLLKDSPVGETDFQNNKCQIMTFTSHDLYLGVKDITHMSTGEITIVILTMQSELSIIASLSSAIDMLLKETDNHSGFPTSVEELKILNCKLQSLEVDIQMLSDKKMAGTDKRRELGNLYERLRSVTS